MCLSCASSFFVDLKGTVRHLKTDDFLTIFFVVFLGVDLFASFFDGDFLVTFFVTFFVGFFLAAFFIGKDNTVLSNFA